MPKLQLIVNHCIVTIDEEDYPKLVTWGYSVALGKTSRLVATRGEFRGKQISRLLLNAAEDVYVDHANGNSLDCTKLNLRPSTPQQNSCNRNVSIWRSLPKGVSLRNGRYHANIEENGKTKYLGSFSTVDGADSKYKEAAEKLHGKYALHNRLP